MVVKEQPIGVVLLAIIQIYMLYTSRVHGLFDSRLTNKINNIGMALHKTNFVVEA